MGYDDTAMTEPSVATNGAVAGMQCSSLQQEIEVGMTKNASSFLDFITIEEIKASEALMKDKITMANNSQFFNYELTPDTWNLLVNKQIYMKFERLLIEKQLTEKKRREDALLLEIARVEKEKIDTIAKRERLETMDVRKDIEVELSQRN
jgi:Cu2+-containing amine oxidase